MDKYICIHGHFYQPPRENPWLEDVEMQDSAYPYHDWNERITAECYAPNTASRVVDENGRVTVIGNNYAHMSFNFGPTLLSWMEKHAPGVYRAVLEADAESRERFSGHGSALAQAYNHMIMPLASGRDKRTQILWGIRDFRQRFGRDPEGMWLPETAVDYETLDIMADQGILFTVLSPYQAKALRASGRGPWEDVDGGRVNPRKPYRCALPSGKTIALFFYDGPISQDLAFGGLLKRGENLAHRLLSAFVEDGEPQQLVHIATDGETYGHHQQFGDMALCYCINYLESNGLARITNYGEYLEWFPPGHEARIHERSAWSCSHGVERWRSDCGCNSGMHGGWRQGWRKPLRESFDWLRDKASLFFETEGARYLRDPWTARDNYIDVVLNRSESAVREFFADHAVRDLAPEEIVRALKLLEMQRNAMLMYTSCGWFFDEVSGIETVQVMQYSCMALQYLEELSGARIDQEYRALLEKIPTNIPEFGNGARIYAMFAKPAKVDFLRVGAHYAISALFDDYPEEVRLYCYDAKADIFDEYEASQSRLFVCRAAVRSLITGEKMRFSSAALHLGEHNIVGGVRKYINDEASKSMHAGITGAFKKGNILAAVNLIQQEFAPNTFSMDSLFKDEKRKLLDKIIQPMLQRMDTVLHQACDGSCAIIDAYRDQGLSVPRELLDIMAFRVNSDLKNLFSDGTMRLERLRTLADEIGQWSLAIDRPRLSLLAGTWINGMIKKLDLEDGSVSVVREIGEVLKTLNGIAVPLNLWESQNVYYRLDMRLHENGEDGGRTREWIDAFHTLGEQLRIKDPGSVLPFSPRRPVLEKAGIKV